METMKDIKARFASAKEGEYNVPFSHYENDERSGVQKLILQYEKENKSSGSGKNFVWNR